jgi:ABC-2 type transport system permease protein
MAGSSLQRTLVIGRKEFLHILRDSQTLFFTLFVPVMELFMLGYAIDTNVRHIRTVVLDQAGTQESRQLVEKFENSTDFNVVQKVYSEREVSQAIVSGKARVGNALALRESLELALGGKPLPIEARPRVLFNPDTRSANFFIPGLMVVMCQMMATMLAANALVREKELGTLEQLYMTPVRRHELILGKMFPYIFLTVFEFCFIAFLMRVIFDVPINGSFMILLSLALPFILTMLGTGLLISTKADTREAAGQMVMGTVLPSIFLSGYVFPFDSMPLPFQILGNIFPTSWLIDASRTVILRGGGWESLWPHTIFLWSMAVVLIILGSLRIQKRLS